MKVIRSRFLPFHRGWIMNLFGIIIARTDAVITDVRRWHEQIHTAQMKEMLWIFFYLWYFVEWLIRLLGKGNAYRSVSLEREAHDFDDYKHYLAMREPFAWLHYVFKKNVEK